MEHFFFFLTAFLCPKFCDKCDSNYKCLRCIEGTFRDLNSNCFECLEG
jgi:hypothetical protein